MLRTPRQHVDRAALAIVVERHLRGDLPACGDKDLQDLVDQACVRGVEQAIQRLTLPEQAHAGPSAQRVRDLEQRPDRQAPRLAALGSRHRRLR